MNTIALVIAALGTGLIVALLRIVVHIALADLRTPRDGQPDDLMAIADTLRPTTTTATPPTRMPGDHAVLAAGQLGTTQTDRDRETARLEALLALPANDRPRRAEQ